MNHKAHRFEKFLLKALLRWLDRVFSGSIPSSQVFSWLDKDESLLWPRLQWHRNSHNNEMTPLPIRNVVYAQTWDVFSLKNPIEPPQILGQKIFLVHGNTWQYMAVPFYVLNILQLILPYPLPTYPPLCQHFALSEK